VLRHRIEVVVGEKDEPKSHAAGWTTSSMMASENAARLLAVGTPDEQNEQRWTAAHRLH
jgi:hypothetical protein